MHEILDYKLLSARYDCLEVSVRKWIKVGWEPLGAPFFDPNAPQMIYQALVAYKTETKEKK